MELMTIGGYMNNRSMSEIVGQSWLKNILKIRTKLMDIKTKNIQDLEKISISKLNMWDLYKEYDEVCK